MVAPDQIQLHLYRIVYERRSPKVGQHTLEEHQAVVAFLSNGEVEFSGINPRAANASFRLFEYLLLRTLDVSLDRCFPDLPDFVRQFGQLSGQLGDSFVFLLQLGFCCGHSGLGSSLYLLGFLGVVFLEGYLLLMQLLLQLVDLEDPLD